MFEVSFPGAQRRPGNQPRKPGRKCQTPLSPQSRSLPGTFPLGEARVCTGMHPRPHTTALSSQLRGPPPGQGARLVSQLCRTQSEDGGELGRRSETFAPPAWLLHRDPGALGLDLTPPYSRAAKPGSQARPSQFLGPEGRGRRVTARHAFPCRRRHSRGLLETPGNLARLGLPASLPGGGPGTARTLPPTRAASSDRAVRAPSSERLQPESCRPASRPPPAAPTGDSSSRGPGLRPPPNSSGAASAQPGAPGLGGRPSLLP